MKTFRDLIAWQKAKSFVVLIYKVTDKFPRAELYSLTDQIRRASVSIPSNIAEGYQRKTTKEFYQFLRIAYSSCAEVETQVEIARDLKYVEEKPYLRLISDIQEIEKILVGLLKSVESKR